ncbi:unnamed protein product, partial [Rotaria sp. Silwood2]
MASRHELDLEQKMNLIGDKENGLSHRQLKEKFQVSLGAVSNILKRKNEYTHDYETNCNKKLKRKLKDDTSQVLNDTVYEWFVAQRSKRIPVSGPILQEYARKVALELNDKSDFKASNGWLDRFRARYNIKFRAISGESAAVDPDAVDDWKSRLSSMLKDYNPGDVYNCDETGLFFKSMPDKSFVLDNNDCKGGKRSKERYTVLLCANWAGTDKPKPVVIGKAVKLRCFKNMNMTKLPVTCFSNRTAWMNSSIFSTWLHEFDTMIGKQQRKIVLFLDNAPVHPPDIKLDNITLKFFPSNTTALIQSMDQGVIRTIKAYYCRQLVQHIITNSNHAYSADDIVVTALDAVCWIDFAWRSITESTLRNTFKAAGFEIPVVLSEPTSSKTTFIDEDVVVQQNVCLNELDRVLNHLTIGGKTMSASDFVTVDDNVPVFNEWNDDIEKILSFDGVLAEDPPQDEQLDPETVPALSEVLKMM